VERGALMVGVFERGATPRVIDPLRILDASPMISMVGEGASSIPSGKLPSPDRGSLFYPRTLFARVGVRLYLLRMTRTCLRAVRTKCSSLCPSLPSNVAANDRTRPRISLCSLDIRKPRGLRLSQIQSRCVGGHCLIHTPESGPFRPASGQDRAPCKNHWTCRYRSCDSVAPRPCRLAEPAKDTSWSPCACGLACVVQC
jgi:hypothetical protein